MDQLLFLVRHCCSEGQAPDSPLTAEGRAQAEALAGFLPQYAIARIVSSPYARALQSIEPLAQRLGIAVETDARLCERVLGAPAPLPWRDALRAAFDDLDLCFLGGESSRVAMQRAVAAIDDIVRHGPWATVVVTHGNLMTLLLRHFDGRSGYEQWQHLTNPDVFRITLSATGAHVERLWGREDGLAI